MSSRLRRGAAVAVLLVAPVLVCAQGLGVTAAIFRQFLVDYWDWRLGDEPELATHVGVHTYDHRWRDWSPAGRMRAREARQEFLQRLVYIATGTLAAPERLSADLLMDELRAGLDAEPWLALVGRLSPARGAHHEVFDTIAQMPARDVDDYERLLARLRALPAWADQQIELLRRQLALGLAQPVEAVDAVIAQIEAQRGASADRTPLLAAFGAFPPAIPEAERARLLAEARAAWEGPVGSAWDALATYLREGYRPAARPEPGLGTLPDGARGYRVLVRAYTGTSLTPEAIHALGLEEVARIEREMQRVIREAGDDATLEAFERSLEARSDLRLEGETAILAHASDVLARLESGVGRLAPRLPRARLEVRAADETTGGGAAVRYTAGTADGRREARLTIDVSAPEARLAHRLDPLVLAAGVPGHHLQLGVTRELTTVPAFRRALDVPVFVNGWALYAESLGTETGAVYRTPAGQFGRLASERRHALSLVLDTGLHALGWSRTEAETFLSRHAPGEPATLIDWIAASPAEALTWKLGELGIRAERRRVERELGPWFDPREFHDVVLRQGAVPLDVLEEQVTAYVAAARATVP